MFCIYLINSSIAQNTDNFITEWQTDSYNDFIIFYLSTNGPIKYSWKTTDSDQIYTGEVSETVTNHLVAIENLPINKTIELSIEPTNLKHFKITNLTNRIYLTNLKQWGTATWNSFEDSFKGAENLQITATDIPNLSNVNSTESMFDSCESITQIPNIERWNTSTVTNMATMFAFATKFNQNLNNWDTSNVINMYGMFVDAYAFNGNISDWNTSKVTNMRQMFHVATSFNQDISKWDTSNVTNMMLMFSEAYAFNQNIGQWNTENVTEMSYMFYDASVFNQNIGNWNTNKVENMYWMFYYASAFNQNISNWDIRNVKYLDNMLDNSGMDCTNYSALLNAWATNPNTPNNITLGANGRTYGTNVVTDRDALLAKGWTITGDTAGNDACNINLSTNTFNKLQIQYYPNPVTDILNITHQNLIKKVEIYTVLGQKIEEQVVNQNQTQFNLAKYPQGIYIVKVHTNTANNSFKISKL